MMWMGQQIEEMSHEELIHIVCELARELDQTRQHAVASIQDMSRLCQTVIGRND
jgi:hypothetical protein